VIAQYADWLLAAVRALPPWEIVAVILAIAYLLLATQEHIACWYCAFLSTAIFTVLFFDVQLLMESALNVYYMAMALYGWQQWRYGGTDRQGVTIRTLSRTQHAAILASILVLSAVSGFLLREHTNAAWPFLDSFTTWASVVTTVLVAHKVLENWLYWFVIDAISIPLYIERGLYVTALLFAAYLVIVVSGYRTWRRHMAAQDAAVAHA
jgi:nicotinamide mononucleotide transporter